PLRVRRAGDLEAVELVAGDVDPVQRPLARMPERRLAAGGGRHGQRGELERGHGAPGRQRERQRIVTAYFDETVRRLRYLPPRRQPAMNPTSNYVRVLDTE